VRRRSTVLTCLLSLLTLAVFAPSAGATPAQFGSEGEGAGQLDEGRGAAVEQSSGDVYIADRNNNRVEEWSKEGEFLRAWGWRVDKEKPEEKLQTCTTITGCLAGRAGAGAGQLNHPSGVAVDSDPLSPSVGDVYVIDAGNNRVEKFGPDGEFILMFGGEGSADGKFEGLGNRQLASIAVDSDPLSASVGDVYVGDANRVQRFSEAGVYEATLLAGAEIDALATAPGGDIYALSSEGAGVREYEASGAEVPPAHGEARDEKGAPETIAAGPGGSLFVDDDLNVVHRIRAYDAAGEETQVFDEGEEDGIYGIGWSEAAGALYVVGSEGGWRVRVVAPPPPGPVVRRGSELASEVEPTTAVLQATVNPEDQEGEGEYDFEYGTAPCTPASCGSATPIPAGKLAKSFEAGELKAPLSGLKPKTTYHFRVVATDSKGHRTVGPEASFTTLPAVQIEETSVSDVAAKSATFSAELDPLGVAARWRIEYASEAEAAKLGTSEAAIAGAGTLAADSPPVAVSEHVQSGLSAATTYYYRVVAEDEREGVPYTVDGPDRTFTTQGEGETVALPDDRAWELVSPPDRHGAPIPPISEEAPVQAAAAGGAIAYGATGAIEAAIEGNRAREASTVLSTHGVGGTSSWSSRDIATANETVAEEGYKGGFGNEYRLFSPDLSTALIEPVGTTPLPPLSPPAEKTLYVRHGNGGFEALVTAANVETGEHFGGSLSFFDATPNLAHVVFSSMVPLTNNATGEGLYEWNAGRLQLVSVLPSGEPESESGMALGAGSLHNMAGAVASEGTRVFWSAEHHLYMFDAGTESSVQLDTVQPGFTGSGSPSAFYEDTSVETSPQGAQVTRAFFTDSQELTPGASEGSLYEYDTQTGELSDLTVPVNAGEAAGVLGLLPGVSDDGSYVYAVAQSVLTTSANTSGETATAGAGNLYELHLQGTNWQPTFIATLSGGDYPDWGTGTSQPAYLTARVSPDGRYLAFMSQRPLTGYDNIDVNEASGRHADEEVYLYDAQSAKLVCASCDPSGARPAGIDDVERPLVDRDEVWPPGTWLAANIPGWTPYATGEALYQSRYLDNAGRVFFNSADTLVPQAVNHTEDVYEYEPAGEGSCTTASSTYRGGGAVIGGCIDLISSGTSSQESAFLDASESGDDVFFLSAARLTPQAPASGYNVYDAHVCGVGWACAAPQPVASPPCTNAESCRAALAPQPSIYGAPSSATFSGAGNLVPAPVVVSKNVTKKAVKCKRGFTKKKNRCVKNKKSKRAKKASRDRRTTR
jgi:hypothetical protein